MFLEFGTVLVTCGSQQFIEIVRMLILHSLLSVTCHRSRILKLHVSYIPACTAGGWHAAPSHQGHAGYWKRQKHVTYFLPAPWMPANSHNEVHLWSLCLRCVTGTPHAVSAAECVPLCLIWNRHIFIHSWWEIVKHEAPGVAGLCDVFHKSSTGVTPWQVKDDSAFCCLYLWVYFLFVYLFCLFICCFLFYIPHTSAIIWFLSFSEFAQSSQGASMVSQIAPLLWQSGSPLWIRPPLYPVTCPGMLRLFPCLSSCE